MIDIRQLCFVYIVEAPRDEDLLDGRTEGRCLQELFRIGNIDHEYNLVTSENTFDLAFGPRLPEAMARHRPNWIPIIHFSCHGDETGLCLTGDRTVSWRELRQRLLPLNDSFREAGIPLLLCISACSGVRGKLMAHTDRSSPGFWALVGHSNKVYWSDAAIGFGAFYHLLFKGKDPDEAVEGMRKASGDDRFEIAYGAQVQEAWLEVRKAQRFAYLDATMEVVRRQLAAFRPRAASTKE